jgi:hypothetical protein
MEDQYGDNLLDGIEDLEEILPGVVDQNSESPTSVREEEVEYILTLYQCEGCGMLKLDGEPHKMRRHGASYPELCGEMEAVYSPDMAFCATHREWIFIRTRMDRVNHVMINKRGARRTPCKHDAIRHPRLKDKAQHALGMWISV